LTDLDLLGRRYGVLPSTIAKNSIVQLQFDMLVAQVGVEEEAKQAKKSNQQLGLRHGR